LRGKGVRVRVVARDRTAGGSRARAGLVQRKKRTLAGGARRPVRGRERGCTGLGYNPGGLWAYLAARPDGSPSALFFFSISFPFFFSIF
jgi:hypothetical protein